MAAYIFILKSNPLRTNSSIGDYFTSINTIGAGAFQFDDEGIT